MKPGFIIAARVDVRKSTFDYHNMLYWTRYHERPGGRAVGPCFWLDFKDTIQFWSYGIYLWQWPEFRHSFWNRPFHGRADCSRRTNNARIQACVKDTLGAELDWLEFNASTFHLNLCETQECWMVFDAIKAQRDVAEAIAAGANEALASRKHYACLKTVYDRLRMRPPSKVCWILGYYPHPGWLVSKHGSHQWAETSLEGVAYESVAKRVCLYDKAAFKNKGTADRSELHGSPLNLYDYCMAIGVYGPQKDIWRRGPSYLEGRCA